MPKVYLGSQENTKSYLGINEVEKAYLGDRLVIDNTSNYYYYVSNVTQTGTLTFDHTTGILSGFSTTSYADLDFTTTSPAVATVNFNCSEPSLSTPQVIFRPTTAYSIYVADNVLKSYTGTLILGKTTILANTDYWLRIVWDGSTYLFYLMVDDGTYMLDNLPDVSSSEWSLEITNTGDVSMFAGFGYNPANSNQYFRGSFNLTKCSITTGGVDYPFCEQVEFIDYITFNSSKYYNIGLNPTADTMYELVFGKNNTTATQFIMGARSGIAVAGGGFMIMNYGATTLRSDGDSSTATITDATDGKHTFYKKGLYNYLDGVQKTSNNKAITAVDYPIFIGAGNQAGSPVNKCSSGITLYKVKIWQGGTLVRNLRGFVYNDVECLYDRVDGTMYTPIG